ncbi:hypothetical protein [Streptomyces sp. CC224B]|uniref:hypothetical protein n=1 Tax=Streptomyces sp. CC224B TaxID=3044571 RepID=UPI0024A97073|nr:hypothetical protein [Streptomyces sp. CC224B]
MTVASTPRIKRKAALLMMSVALTAGATATSVAASPSTASDVGAQSCYGSAKNYTAIGNGIDRAYWPNTGFKYTTGNCADINIKTNHKRVVRACWKTIPCSGWVTAPKGQWVEVKSNVPDGWGFYLEFKGGNNGTGKVAY